MTQGRRDLVVENVKRLIADELTHENIFDQQLPKDFVYPSVYHEGPLEFPFNDTVNAYRRHIRMVSQFFNKDINDSKAEINRIQNRIMRQNSLVYLFDQEGNRIINSSNGAQVAHRIKKFDMQETYQEAGVMRLIIEFEVGEPVLRPRIDGSVKIQTFEVEANSQDLKYPKT